MKRFFYSVLAAATMLFTTTSCSEDDVVTPEVGYDGNTQKVTFKVEMPGEGVASRAIADGVNVGGGNQADKLIWALYEKGKDANRLDFGLVEGTLNQDTKKHEFTADISMVKGLTYNVLFFAYDADGCVFQLNTEDPDLTALKLKSDLEANVEGYDAFVKCHEHTVKSGNEVTTVTLKRPFAQINAATTVEDLDRAKKLQAVVTKSELVIKNVPTQYNVLTGEATENADLTYKASPILTHYPAVTEGHPNEDITVDNVGYKYLAMAYVLAGATEDSKESMHDATFNFYRGDNGDDLMRNIDIINLPIQRNHRTNVIGDLLTETESFKIVIDEQFDEPDHNINGAEEDATTTTVATAAELQAAIDAASGPTIIKFEQDIDANSSRSAVASITIKQKEGVDLVIDGCGYKFNGVMTVNGDGRSTGKETLTFNNINFETTDSDTDEDTRWSFIDAPSKLNGKYNYSHNVTIENCTFTNTVETTYHVGSASFTGTYNLEMKNCTAINMHSILQVQSCDNTAVVDNIKTINCKNGVSFGNTAYPTISNSEINSNAYGIRGDGNATRGNLVIKNTTINADVPVIIRKVTTDGYKVALEGNTVLDAKGLYHVVFTEKSDDVAYVAPTKSWSVTGAEGFNVYPMEEGAAMSANSTAQLTAAIKAGATSIKLAAGNYEMPDGSESVNLQGKTLTITGTKETVIDVSNVDTRDQFVTGATMSFEGVTLKFNGSDPNKLYMGFANTKSLTYTNCNITGLQILNGEKVTFENCVLDSQDNTMGQPHSVWTYGAKNVSFTECTFKYGHRAVNCYKDQDIDGGKQVVNFKECKFITDATDSEGGVEINSSAFSVGIVVNMEGCTAPAYGEMAYVSPWDSTNGAKTTINIK